MAQVSTAASHSSQSADESRTMGDIRIKGTVEAIATARAFDSEVLKQERGSPLGSKDQRRREGTRFLSVLNECRYASPPIGVL